jgi:hypothetical protein
MLSIVATRLRLVSRSGARVGIAFQRPLNSSISVMSFRISGGNRDVLYLMHDRISILTHFSPDSVRPSNGISIYIHFHSFISQVPSLFIAEDGLELVFLAQVRQIPPARIALLTVSDMTIMRRADESFPMCWDCFRQLIL